MSLGTFERQGTPLKRAVVEGAERRTLNSMFCASKSFRRTMPYVAAAGLLCVLVLAAGPASQGWAAETGAAARVASYRTITLQSQLGTVTAGQRLIMSSATGPRTTNQRYIRLRATINGRRWTTVGSMTYNASVKKYIRVVTPSTLTVYRAVWLNAAGRVQALSPKVAVRTRLRLRFYSSSYAPALGRRVRLFGSIWPPHGRRRVTIQLRSGTTWNRLFARNTDTRGNYSAGLFKPRVTGSYYVRALVSAPDETHLGNAVGPKRIRSVESRMAAEGRAVWVPRFEYASGSQTNSKAKIRQIMRTAWEGNCNIVYFQVRGQGDAYYDCPTSTAWAEPWAARLTSTRAKPGGTLGKNPGWDPLAYAITWAHWYGLELHAWVNVYPVWMGKTAPPVTTPLHMYYKGTTWRVATRFKYRGHWYYRPQRLNKGYLWGTPGNPLVRQHIRGVVMYIAANYDIDGLHLDRLQYPGKQYSWDKQSRIGYAVANEKYKATHHGHTLSRAVWQRLQISALVSEIYKGTSTQAGVKDIDPTMQVSAACYGIYANRWRWRGVRTGINDFYQDSQGWLRAGTVDALAPMIFWGMKQTPTWDTLATDFAAHRGSRFVYPGIAAFMYRGDWTELSNEVQSSRVSGAQGVSFYSWRSLSGRWKKLSNLFPEMVDTPLRGSETDVSLESTTTTVSLAQRILLFGAVLPHRSGARVTVLQHVGMGWDVVGAGTTDAYGHYEVPFVGTTTGVKRFRAIFSGGGEYAAAKSRDLAITVVP